MASKPGSYEEACAAHSWDVPERYNIAADVCDKHPRDKLAMVWEDFAAPSARSAGASSQDLVQPRRQRPARPRRRARRPGRGRPAAHARDRRRLLRHLEARGDPALDVGPLRRRGDPPPVEDSRPTRAGHRRRPTRGRFDASLVDEVLVLDDDAARRRPDRLRARGHRRPTTPPSSTTRRAPPGWRRASSTPTATSSPTRSSSTATTSATASSSTAWGSGRGRRASRRCSGPWRLGAIQFVYQREGGFDPAQAARRPLPPRGRRTSSRRRPRCGR